MYTGFPRFPDSRKAIFMSTERISEEPQTCPHCGQLLHEEPIIIDHALRVGLACTQHGVATITEPFTI